MAALRTLEEDFRALNLWNPQLGTSRNGSENDSALTCESRETRDEAADLLKRAGLPVAANGELSVSWSGKVSEAEEKLGAEVLGEAGFRFVGGVLKKAKSAAKIAKEAGGFSALRKKRKKLRVTRRRNKSKIRRQAKKIGRKSSTKRRRKKQLRIRKRRGLSASMSYGRIPSLVEELQGIAMKIDGTEHKRYLAQSFGNVAETAEQLATALKEASGRYRSEKVLEAIKESLLDLEEMVEVSAELIEHLKSGGAVIFEDASEEINVEEELEDMAEDLADSMELFQDLGVISVNEETDEDDADCDDEEEDEDEDDDEDDDSDMGESRDVLSRLDRKTIVARRA